MDNKINIEQIINDIYNTLLIKDESAVTDILKSIINLNKRISNNIKLYKYKIKDKIQKWEDAGLSKEQIIKNVADDVITRKGATFGYITTNIFQNVTNTTTHIERAIEKAYNNKYGITKEMWVTKSTNACPDCLENHGVIHNSKYWDETGIPNVKNTVCTIRGACHCELIPMITEKQTDIIKTPIKLSSGKNGKTKNNKK